MNNQRYAYLEPQSRSLNHGSGRVYILASLEALTTSNRCRPLSEG